MAATDTAEPHGRRCAGTSKQTGKPCQLPPKPGAPVCRFHGGDAPQVIAAAERRLQEEAAEAYKAKYGIPVHIEWHEAIPLGIDETYGNLLAMRDLIQKIAPAALTWGETEVRTIGASQFPGVDITQAAGIVPQVQLYERERDRLHRQAVDAGKLNLDARRQQLAEADATRIVEAFRKLVAALGRDMSDPVVQRVFAEEFAPLAVSA